MSEFKKFHNVEATLSSFYFCYERLWTLQKTCEIILAQTKRFSALDEQGTKMFVFFAMNGFSHSIIKEITLH